MLKPEPDKFPLLTYIDELVEELRGHVPKAMKQWDAEAIHKSRVATRRLKAALDLLKPVLSDEHLKPFAEVLKKLRRRLGPMRDLDVMIGHLGELKAKPQADAVAWLTQRLDANRDAVRKELSPDGAHARVLSRLGTWWGLREEVAEAQEAADSLLAERLHLQLDSFAEQADRLAAASAHPDGAHHQDGHHGTGHHDAAHTGTSHAGTSHTAAVRQDPHAVRIAGKSFRYTLEMAAVQGHKLPAGIMGSFKRMQESLGVWHDYVVLTERAMQLSLQALLPHHDAELQSRVLDLSRILLKRSSHHLNQFCVLWAKGGGDVAKAVRETFPLTKPVTEPKTDPDPPGSNGSAPPAEARPDAIASA